MIMHDEKHPMAGRTVSINIRSHDWGEGDHEFRIEDWWDRVTGGSWMDAKGNPAALIYAVRSVDAGLPLDNQVVYGHIKNRGTLVHVSELPNG